MNDHCDLLLFLDKTNVLIDMKRKCEEFLGLLNEKTIHQFPPLRYKLEVDVMEVFNKFSKVAQLLLDEPVKWKEICADILYSCLCTLYSDQSLIQRAQMDVLLIIKSLPHPLASPNSRHYKGLTTFQGVLTAVSKPTNYVYHTVWSCPEECEDNEVVLTYIPKSAPRCHICKSLLFEISGYRRCGEQVEASFAMPSDLLCRKFKIPDYLFGNLVLGSAHKLTGVVIKKSTYIWSIEQAIRLAAPVTTPVPKEVDKLLATCGGIPWKFIYCLASSIAINVCPLNCFMHLKIKILLSLASLNANSQTGRSILHVLAAGLDTGFVGSIFSEASKLASRSIHLGITNTGVHTGLAASNGGITVLPLPLHTYHQKEISKLLSCIESNEIIIDNATAKLQSAVWAHGMDFKNMAMINVASVFGSLCRGDLGEYSDEMVDFVLQKAIENNNQAEEEKRVINDIKHYLDAVAGIHVRLHEMAETILKNYFLAVRKDRPRGVTVGTMNTLVAMCLTSACLCRRGIANVDDAMFAIWLQESGCPEPSSPEEYLQAPSNVKTLERNMQLFKNWLEEFTGNILEIL